MEDTKQLEKQRTIDLSVLLSVFKKCWLVALCVAILAGIVAFCYSHFFVTPMYGSTVKMIIDVKVSNTDKVTNEQIVTSIRLTETIKELIVTDSILSPILDELDLDVSPSDLANRITITSEENSQVITIKIIDSNSKTAHKIAEKLKHTVPVKINELFESGNVAVLPVDGPTTGSSPVSPNIKRNVVVSVMIGFIVVLALGFIRYLLNFTFSSSDDIKGFLGLKVLGVIPSFESLEKAENKKRGSH